MTVVVTSVLVVAYSDPYRDWDFDWSNESSKGLPGGKALTDIDVDVITDLRASIRRVFVFGSWKICSVSSFPLGLMATRYRLFLAVTA